jgi:hypothetical protein
MGNIAILNPGGVGDMLLSSSVLRYKDELWPGKNVVWYCQEETKHVLSNVTGLKEVRLLENVKDSWYSWYEPSDCEQLLVTSPWMAKLSKSCVPIDFSPGTLMVDKPRLIVEKATSTRILGPWHPCLGCSADDRNVAETIDGCLPNPRTVMLETAYYSGQSFLDMEILARMMGEIRQAWGDCNFVLVSGGKGALLPEGKDVFACPKLSLSAVVALFNRCDAFIGVSSGLSCAVCSWDASPDVPRLEIIRNPAAETRKSSRGPFSAVLNEEQLFAKLPEFLAGKHDYVPAPWGKGPSVLFEKKKYSQNGEDGIIESLFNHVGTTNKFFVEIGVGDGTENNTRKLAEEGWRGKWLSLGPIRHVPQGVESVEIRVTAENVNRLLEGVPQEIDLLSIDIDGNDYYVWDAIERVSPRVVAIEYNPFLPPPTSRTIQYDPEFRWTFTDYFGASLCALNKLAERKGYSLVCCDRSGTNAFFAKGLPKARPEDAYVPFKGYGDEFKLGWDSRKWVEI